MVDPGLCRREFKFEHQACKWLSVASIEQSFRSWQAACQMLVLLMSLGVDANDVVSLSHARAGPEEEGPHPRLHQHASHCFARVRPCSGS